MRDLIAKAAKLGKRVSFQEFVQIDDKIKDVTDLIINFRDGAVHSDSYRKMFHGSSISFSRIFGKSSAFGQVSEFEDDICYVLGNKKMYHKRHLLRCFEELKSVFKDLSSSNK